MPSHPARRNRLILICAVTAFSVSVLVGLGQLVHQGARSKGVMHELVFWAAAQTEHEYWRFIETFDRFALGDREVSRDDVITRLDILWSRLNLYGKGPAGARLNRIPGTPEFIDALAKTLNEIEPEIERLRPGDPVAYAKIRARLTGHVVGLRVVVQRTNRTEQAEAVEAFDRSLRTRQILLGLMVGVFFLGALLITLLLREEKRARSFANEAMEARQVAVRHSEHVRKIVETVDDAIVTVDPDGTILEINTAGQATFGLPASEITGTSLLDRFTEANRRSYLEFMSGRVAGDEERVGKRLKAELLGPDGTPFPAEISLGEMVEREQRSFVVVIRDLTEQHQTQIQLLHAQKMDALGKLTGEVAHEFNNLLTAIGGFAHMAHRSLDDRDRVERCLSEVIAASDSAAALTGQMLAFGRKQQLNPRSVSVREVIRNLAALLEPLITEKIELSIPRPSADPHVWVDAAQLTQALLNLAINATHAMPDGGELTIRVGLRRAEAERHPSSRDGDFVAFSVTDTGTGIDPETAEHIFEPFFSTKGEGKGTGLGLSMVHGMVEQSGGWIELDTELGRGTTFTIFLLSVEADEAAADPRGSVFGPESAASGKGVILLVEDKEQVQELAALALADTGYEVLRARDGAEAVRIFEARNGDIDLLISDVAMPKKDGFALGRELRTLRPDLAIIFMSGHAMRGSLQGSGIEDNVEFIQKPFDPRDLARLVAARLSG